MEDPNNDLYSDFKNPMQEEDQKELRNNFWENTYSVMNSSSSE